MASPDWASASWIHRVLANAQPPNHLSNLATKHTEMKGSLRMQCDEFGSAGFALHLLSCSSCQDTASWHLPWRPRILAPSEADTWPGLSTL
jgi:hypothetical protein